MSVDVKIKQKGFFKKKLTLEDLKTAYGENCGYGVSNQALALDPLDETNYHNTYIIFYNTQKIGRGFSVLLDSKGTNLSLNLNIPCTIDDVNQFYRFIKSLCTLCKTNQFEQDGQLISLSEISTQQKNIETLTTNFSNELFHNEEQKDIIIFGAVYPISIENDFIQQIRQNKLSATLPLLEDYLHEKQNRDYYYAKAIIYQNQTGNTFGAFALTENVASIVPLTPHLPVLLQLEESIEVEEWFVILPNSDATNEGMLQIPFSIFKNKVKLDEKAAFDRNHVLFTLTKEMVDQLKDSANDSL